MKYELVKLREDALHAVYSDYAGSGCIMRLVKYGDGATRWTCDVPGVGTWRGLLQHVHLLACEGAEFIVLDYPNVGNRTRFVSVQTASGNRWIPQGGQAAIGSAAAASANVATTVEGILFQLAIANGVVNGVGQQSIWQNNDVIRLAATISKSAGVETLTTRLRLGTAGTTADTAIFTSTSQLAGSSRANNIVLEAKRASATSVLMLTTPALTTAFAAAVTVSNMDTSGTMFLTLTGQFATNATSETARLEDARATLVSHIL